MCILEVSEIERKILHVDVNNAFLSWAAVDMLANGAKQDIRKIPAVIGGDEKARKGIVLAKSALAKKMKITTGESLFQARKKCPNLQVFPGDFKLYKKMSDAMTSILLEYTDQVEEGLSQITFKGLFGDKAKDLGELISSLYPPKEVSASGPKTSTTDTFSRSRVPHIMASALYCR